MNKISQYHSVISYLLLFVVNFFSFTYGQKVDIQKLGDFPKHLDEISGMVKVGVDSFLVINDSGNKPEVYLVNAEAIVLKTVYVKNAKNKDWEDLALDKKGFLYIGDIGNNSNKRKQLHILKVHLKNIFLQDTVEVEKISFHYPEQLGFPPQDSLKYFDAEALWVMHDSLFILTKNRTKPFDGISYLYRLPSQPGEYQAEKIDEYITCDNNMIKCWVTAADYHPSSGYIAVLTTKEVHFLKYDKGKLSSKYIFRIPGMKQRESICFGSHLLELFIADEVHKVLGGGSIYRLIWEK